MPETPPSDREAERSILGAILLDNKAYDEAAGAGLVAEDFSLDSHRLIYRSMERLAAASVAIDLRTLISSLRDSNNLIAVGDVGYISELVGGVPDRPSIKNYIRIAKEKAAQRSIINACNATIGRIAESSSSAEVMDYLQDQILQIQTGTDEAPAERVIKFSDAAYQSWLEVVHSTGEIIGLSTGIPGLDKDTTGIRPGEQWVIGARTGGGKTNLGLQIASASCLVGIPVGIFSLEMDRAALLQRLWAQAGAIPYRNIRHPRYLQEETIKNIERAMTTVGKWPLFIADEASMSLSKMVSKAKLLIRKEKVKLLIIDYVQKVRAPGKDERTQVTKISETLRTLAKDTGVPTVLLSQFSRADQNNRNKRPTKYDFKESGSLENDAHVCLLIHRPEDDLNKPTGQDEIIIGKQRSGECGIEHVELKNTLRFEERPDEPRIANGVRE